MSKTNLVIAGLVVLAFLGITIKTMVDRIRGSETVLANQNQNNNGNIGISSNFEDVIGSFENAALQNTNNTNSGNIQQNSAAGVALTGATCTTNVTALQNETWYQNFVNILKQEKREEFLQKICVSETHTEISFLHKDTGGTSVRFWRKGSDTTKEATPLNTETNTYDISGWLNASTLLYSQKLSATSREYRSFNIPEQTTATLQTCSITTTTLVCGTAEQAAWGCSLGTTSAQEQEDCTAPKQ